MHRFRTAPRPVRGALSTLLVVAALTTLLALAQSAAAQAAVTPAAVTPAAADPAGTWKGAIELPGQSLAVTVELAADAGAWSGSIDIPAQGARDLPLTGVVVDGAGVRFQIGGVPGEPTFTGTLSADGATLAGDFTQGGQTFPFRLAREDAAAAADALAGFDEWMTAQLAAWEVPGAAVAVVRDGKVLLARGYGLRDVEAGLPVTGDTVFAIGSATKAFTATVLATLADEGKLDWDAPVRRYLPDFELEDDFVSARATPRDLVTHRIGLPRHDLVWYGSRLSRQEIYERLRHLEPTAGLRERFQYQNLMYMTAGLLAGELAGSSWEAVVEERILAPLGMDDTTLGIAGLAEADDAARGYQEKDVDDDGSDEIVQVDYRDLDALGPAGSINSTAQDMARWVLLQLGGGSVEGKQVISETALKPLYDPRIPVEGGLFSAIFKQPEMPYLHYGMGWFVQPYRGIPMIHHGGNIDGFSALVSFLPRENTGLVVLTNRNGTLLTTVTALHLYDRLLDLEAIDWSARYQQIRQQMKATQEAAEDSDRLLRHEGTRPSHDLADYPGTFHHPAYGDLAIERRGDGLAVRLNAFDAPLEHWHYDVFRVATGDTEGTKLSFVTTPEGYLDRVEASLEQGVEPIRFERQAPPELSDPASLRRYEGTFDLLGAPLTVALRGDQLTLTVPGQGTVELDPLRRDHFAVRGEEGSSVRFRMADGAPRSLLLVQPGGALEVQRRQPEDGAEDAPQEGPEAGEAPPAGEAGKEKEAA